MRRIIERARLVCTPLFTNTFVWTLTSKPQLIQRVLDDEVQGVRSDGVFYVNYNVGKNINLKLKLVCILMTIAFLEKKQFVHSHR